MTDERWADVIGQLKDDGKVEESGTDEFNSRPGTVEWYIISSPLGRIKLSRTSEPKKISEKALYSKRGDSTANIQAKYDDSEIIHAFFVEKELPNGNWEPVNTGNFPV